VRTYTEEYEYDLLGNIKALKHHFKPQPGIGDGWTRHYRYVFDDNPGNRTNRLMASSMPGDPDAGPYTGTYDYDAYGNMTRMSHLAAMDWNFMDQLQRVDLGGGGTGYYVYGVGGQRLRKVIERNGNTKLEWIYLGAVMIFRRRRRNTNALRFERWTVNISDNTGHIAQVDVKTQDDDNDDPANPLNVPLIRYQYTNHLGSAVLETDGDGNPISYEEYHPYGTTAYRSSKPGFDLSLKRYRFSGKERDDETGLYYFGARYYAPWLGRWTSADPADFVDGLNQYVYCLNSSISNQDPNGLETSENKRIGGPEIRGKTFTGKESKPELDQIARDRGYMIKGNPYWEEGYGWRAELVPVNPTNANADKIKPDNNTASKDTESDPEKDGNALDKEQEKIKPNDVDSPTSSKETSAKEVPAKSQDGFWKSIVSGKEEPSFGKSLIPVIGSVQSANYHFDKGNWGRGIGYTALAISDVFLVRSLVTGAVRLAARGVVSLRGIGSTIAKELSLTSGVGSGTKLATKLKRFFIQDLSTYNRNASTVFRILREHFKVTTSRGTQSMFEMHHWLIQRSWFSGSNPIQNRFLRETLKKVGNAGWNLIPIPSTINNALGQSSLATFSFAEKLSSVVIKEFQWAFGIDQ